MQILIKILAIVCLIGALNWGFIGLFNIDLVALIFGNMTILTRLIYTLVGLSAIMLIILSINEYKKIS